MKFNFDFLNDYTDYDAKSGVKILRGQPMSRLLKLAGEQSHKRNIEVTTYSADISHLVTEGRLTDVRLKDYYKFTGERVDGGTLHDLRLVLLVKIPELIIEDLEVIIETVPRSDCYLISKSLDPVIGLAIKGGFSAKVRELAGGVAGCTHLVHLLTTMAPAIMQGYWAYLYQQKPDISKPKDGKKAGAMSRGLKNSCFTWREDGEAYQKMITLLKEKFPGE